MCGFSHTEGRREFERERKDVMVWSEREKMKIKGSQA